MNVIPERKVNVSGSATWPGLHHRSFTYNATPPPPPAVLPNRKCLCLLSCLESLQGLCETDYDSVWYSKSVNPPPDFTLAPALQHQPLQKISGRTSDLAPHSYAGLNCGISWLQVETTLKLSFAFIGTTKSSPKKTEKRKKISEGK